MKIAVAFVSGLVFALGLGLSGMLLPAKIIGFLDVAGNWDPSLLLVMGPAVGLVLVAWLLRRGRPSPWGQEVPGKGAQHLDSRLYAGAGLFGIGWALAGVCPGPAVTNLAAPSSFTLVALAAMLVGIALSFLRRS
jgi:uncharacterized membrane protein YedE/YeeE